ncbi:UPF0658 Golgi apparatus membrane protein [Yarrowia sp. C11]|nr:UPF0658 Golgi apparatus membrane protein [Yarrowia sp. E02]KAG5369302.1 UPF0658 Golgi apparatus membrane protein [Yarrowia sp. C11]
MLGRTYEQSVEPFDTYDTSYDAVSSTKDDANLMERPLSLNEYYHSERLDPHYAPRPKEQSRVEKLLVSRFSKIFFATIIIQAVIVLAFEGFIFAQFQKNLKENIPSSSNTRAIAVYLALYIFAEIFVCILSYLSLWKQNIMEIYGICIFMALLVVYGAIAYDQMYTAILDLTERSAFDATSWALIKAFLVAVPCVIGLALIIVCICAYKLKGELGWITYRNVGADLIMRRRWMQYEIFMTILKFDFFFFLGFTVQFIVVVLNVKDVEFGLTIAVIPLTIIFLYLLSFFAKKEYKLGMLAMQFVLLAALAYFIFKLVRIYDPDQEYKYEAVRKSLTIFAAITMALVTATMALSVVCILNFHKGLKPIIEGRKKDPYGMNIFTAENDFVIN